VRPVIGPPGEYPDPLVLPADDEAIAFVFYLVDPCRSFGDAVARAQYAGLDERRRHRPDFDFGTPTRTGDIQKVLLESESYMAETKRDKFARFHEPGVVLADVDPAEVAAVREHLVKSADYVGPKFPEEARKMHYGETEHRSIYGEASPDEAKALHEEGIEFHPLPRLPDDRN
jgi:hypothetical protein